MRRRDFFIQMFKDSLRRTAEPRWRPQPETWSDDAITGSCLGHSTVLMNFLGVWVLTDPVFSSRVGLGVSGLILGPKRFIKPALRPGEFPAPDVIVLSHAHFDHLDRRSLRKFSRDTVVVTAQGTRDLLKRFRHVHELAWGQSITVSTRQGQLRVTAIEVAHWGARMIRDTHRGYGGFVLQRTYQEKDYSICYAGDTTFTRAFEKVRAIAPALQLALMPIGAYNPWIAAHCTPEQAVAMADQAGAMNIVPIHHETFRLSAEPMDEPAQRIEAAMAGRRKHLLALHVGETFRVPLRDHSAVSASATAATRLRR
ncbi:MAG TPA: MBL fold metallo-hydrolase [Opitutaceae bacterium]|nr:MBL fold metallo-hydrolase [Opitutaceae bacterium]